MCDQKNPDPDVADLRKKVRYKRASGRGKYKEKDSPIEHSSYLSLTARDGHIVITVDDYELFDFLDDFFADQSMDSAFVSTSLGAEGQELHSLHFGPGHTIESIRQVLHLIPNSEIQRIHNLNKP
jgi:hypothetical protein